jgi:hypothetical protein
MSDHNEPQLHSFEGKWIPAPPGTLAPPRPTDRPREMPAGEPACEPELVTFECVAEVPPPGTPAPPRPASRPRELDSAPVPSKADADFARELAERVLEYVRNCPAGLSAEQLAALVQQILARRSA